MVVRNVAELADPPHPARPKTSTLTPEEVERFLDAAGETSYYVFFSSLLYTGLRRGELLALKWRNVDLDGGRLYVVESAHKLGDGRYIVNEPKTSYSRRTVTLSPSLIVLLREYHADQVLLRLQLEEKRDNDDFVFSRADGSPLNANAITLAFKRIIHKAGLRQIRVHDLHHTQATLMLKGGVHPKIVSERLGHANIGITLDTYSHVLPGPQEAATQGFDQLLESGQHTRIGETDVSKMLANSDDLASEPWETRTPDTLIKSQVLYQLS